MARYTGPLLTVAAIGALGSISPSHEFRRNVYLDADDCRRDYPGSLCTNVATVRGETRSFGPWYTGERAAAVSQLAIGVITEVRRGGFGGWACGPGDGRDRRGGGG